jgi:hypothetical protein
MVEYALAWQALPKGSKKVPKDVRWPETKCNGVDVKYADKIWLT